MNGMVEEGLAIVRGVRDRYEGYVRNPFNEYECGNYYGRALASYALLQALGGFRYSAVTQTLWFGPKIADRPFKIFFSAASGFGTIQLESDRLTVEMIEGDLSVKELRLMIDEHERVIDAGGTASTHKALVIPLGKSDSREPRLHHGHPARV